MSKEIVKRNKLASFTDYYTFLEKGFKYVSSHVFELLEVIGNNPQLNNLFQAAFSIDEKGFVRPNKDKNGLRVSLPASAAKELLTHFKNKVEYIQVPEWNTGKPGDANFYAAFETKLTVWDKDEVFEFNRFGGFGKKDNPRMTPHSTIQMAQKGVLVNLVLEAFGLNTIYTSDMEDKFLKNTTSTKTYTKPQTPSTNKNLEALSKEVKADNTERDEYKKRSVIFSKLFSEGIIKKDTWLKELNDKFSTDFPKFASFSLDQLDAFIEEKEEMLIKIQLVKNIEKFDN